MWFKNLLIYRFTRPFEHSATALEQALGDFTFSPCGSQDLQRYGWVSPFGKYGETLVHASGPYLWICARKEEKILPAGVIREALAEKVEEIENEQARPVRGKEKQQLKDEIIQTLLPRAFTRHMDTHAYIDTQSGLLMIDASSFNKAEELMAHLRSTLGSLPVLPVQLAKAPAGVMTAWLEHGNIPDSLTLGDEVELREPGESGAVVRIKGQAPDDDDVLTHINSGKQVAKLALEYAERVQFVINEEFAIKRLKFTDLVTEEMEDIGSEDPAAQLDADFALMCGELANLIPDLIAAFGGEADPQAI